MRSEMYPNIVPEVATSLPTYSEIDIIQLAFEGRDQELLQRVDAIRRELGGGQMRREGDEDEDEEDEYEEDALSVWINTHDSNGVTALLAACIGGHVQCLKIILEVGDMLFE